MKRALLFDLDGTLLPVDTHAFVEETVKIMAGQLADVIQPERFVAAVWKAVEAVVANQDENLTNEQVFYHTFFSHTDLDREEIIPKVERFYHEVFPTLGHLCQPTPLAKEIMEEAKRQGYVLVVATNPLYPRQAIWTRMQWAGVDHIPFALVTTYENCSFAKPNLAYYEAICQRIGMEPKQCIMVGNDMQEDMCAIQLGMKTFLVTDWLIDRGTPRYTPHDEGSLAQLYERLRRKEGVFA